MPLCLEHVAGRVPVIVTISRFASPIVVARARTAREMGADIVMVMPPYHRAFPKDTAGQTVDQFRAVGEVGIPIMRQDAPLLGVELPVSLFRCGWRARSRCGSSPRSDPRRRPPGCERGRIVGRIAVFGASNFPPAFSTAGGDMAAALAAGCPVVVEGRAAHPGAGELVSEAAEAAPSACGLYPAVFALLQGGRQDVGEALVQHPLIRGSGSTVRLPGRTLFDMCMTRPDPIPFFWRA